jgi:hypothetical protein
MRVSILPSLIPNSLDLLRILVLSDLHLNVKPAATQLLYSDQEYLKQMDYIVLLGDQTPAWGTDEEYCLVDDFIAQLPRPYGAINGNHEFFFEVIYDDSLPAGRVFNQASPFFKSQRLEKFRNFFGYEKLWRAQRTPLGVFIFLGLDDIEHSRPEALSTPQQEFLETELRKSHNEPVYIFCHAPLSLGRRLDLTYYEETRTACIELAQPLRELCQSRRAPLFWMSGHIHLRPDHYLYPAYQLADQVWQVHCPDSIGYSRWTREQIKPEFHDELYSRSLEISRNKVALRTRDHVAREDIAWQVIKF